MEAREERREGRTRKSNVHVGAGNDNKRCEVEAILGQQLGRMARVTAAELEVPELQWAAMDIAREKCRLARKARLRRSPVW